MTAYHDVDSHSLSSCSSACGGFGGMGRVASEPLLVERGDVEAGWGSGSAGSSLAGPAALRPAVQGAATAAEEQAHEAQEGGAGGDVEQGGVPASSSWAALAGGLGREAEAEAAAVAPLPLLLPGAEPPHPPLPADAAAAVLGALRGLAPLPAAWRPPVHSLPPPPPPPLLLLLPPAPRRSRLPSAGTLTTTPAPALPPAPPPAGSEDFDACFDLRELPGAEALLGGSAHLELDEPACDAAHELENQPGGEGGARSRAAELPSGPFDYGRGFALAMSTSHLEGSPRVSEEEWTLVEGGEAAA
jgi:hypothetical protein